MCYNKYSYEIKYDPTKHIETTERGLVVVSVNEPDGGRYDCHLGGSLLCSYSITVDAHRYDKTYNNNNNKIQYKYKLLFFYFFTDVRHLTKAMTIRKSTRTGVMSLKSINQP